MEQLMRQRQKKVEPIQVQKQVQYLNVYSVDDLNSKEGIYFVSSFLIEKAGMLGKYNEFFNTGLCRIDEAGINELARKLSTIQLEIRPNYKTLFFDDLKKLIDMTNNELQDSSYNSNIKK